MKYLPLIFFTVLTLFSGSSVAVTITELEPAHSRPYLLPQAEKKRILDLIETHDWGKEQFEKLKKNALAGKGHNAAFIFALTGDSQYLEIARKWLLETSAKGGDLGKRAKLADAAFFNQGLPWLSDVFYQINTDYFEAYDFVYNHLNPDEINAIEQGIKYSANFRAKSMDTWRQTANLVFKPTSMVAIAGLVSQDPEQLQWGFFRKPGSSLGGYFSALNTMLVDNGPWLEAPTYALNHKPLYQSLKISDYLQRMTEKDWFNKKLGNQSSVRGLIDYYLNTSYPGEKQPNDKYAYRILTYGDGATGQRGDYFLVTPNQSQTDMSKELSLAYKLSNDPKYSAFLSDKPQYRPDLTNHPVLPEKPTYPAAPSSIWPKFGLAFLRSDQTPNYWQNPKAMAASLLFKQGYGHGHADALSMTLFANGQLFYPDYNPMQYENPALGWTASSLAHNTVMVDGNNSSKPIKVSNNHEFSNDFSYVQADVDEPLGLKKIRTLAMTPDYMLDVFHIKSLIPRTYDYLLHSFGRVQTDNSVSYEDTKPFSPRLKDITNFKSAQHSKNWSVNFVIDQTRFISNTEKIIENLADTDEKKTKARENFAIDQAFDFATAELGFTMAAENNTLIGLGEDKYGLSFLTARRTNQKQTTFIGLHDPKTRQDLSLEKVFESEEGVIIKVTSSDFIHLHAISTRAKETNLYDPNSQTGINFKHYALIKINLKNGNKSHYGNIESYSIPAAFSQSPKPVTHGEYQLPTLEGLKTRTRLIQINTYPKVVVLKDFADTNVTISITNTSDKSLSGTIKFAPISLGITSDNQETIFNAQAYQTTTKQISLPRYKKSKAPDILPVEIYLNENQKTIEHGLLISSGPGLFREFEQEDQPIYTIHTYDAIYDYDMRTGYLSKISKSDGSILYDDKPIFYFSDEKTIITKEKNNITTSFTWADQDYASITSELNNLIRWQIFTIQNRFHLKLDPTYTRPNKVEMIFDKLNTAINWSEATLIQNNKLLKLSEKNDDFTPDWIELPLTKSNSSLCLKAAKNMTWTNTSGTLKLQLSKNPKDQVSYGICPKGNIANWL